MTAGCRVPEAEQGLRLLSVVAHEVRGPLMALGVSTELLAENLEEMEWERVRAMIEGVRARVLWLNELVENLLCADALREDSLHLHRQPLDLEETLAAVQVVVRPLLEHRQQRLRLPRQGRRRLPDVLADSRRVGQVLVNLILNASKFAPRKTEIKVMVRQRVDVVRVTIADRGPGLPSEDTSRLFEPFYRAAPTRDQQGLGLGLSIVQLIVDAHGGRVGAYQRDGGGACFWFELPCAHTPCAPSEAAAQGK